MLLIAGAGIAVGATMLLKPLVGRTIHGGHLSYPSGHTAFATALALVAAMLATGRLGLGRAAGASLVLGAALVAGAATGWAQVALDAHYPTDALGGWLTALAAVPATAWLTSTTAPSSGPTPSTASERERSMRPQRRHSARPAERRAVSLIVLPGAAFLALGLPATAAPAAADQAERSAAPAVAGTPTPAQLSAAHRAAGS